MGLSRNHSATRQRQPSSLVAGLCRTQSVIGGPTCSRLTTIHWVGRSRHYLGFSFLIFIFKCQNKKSHIAPDLQPPDNHPKDPLWPAGRSRHFSGFSFFIFILIFIFNCQNQKSHIAADSQPPNNHLKTHSEQGLF